MSYIDRNKIDFRIPYCVDDNSDVLVSLNAVKHCISIVPDEDVIPGSTLTEFLEALGDKLNEVAGHKGLYTISETDLHELRKRFGG